MKAYKTSLVKFLPIVPMILAATLPSMGAVIAIRDLDGDEGKATFETTGP